MVNRRALNTYYDTAVRDPDLGTTAVLELETERNMHLSRCKDANRKTLILVCLVYTFLGIGFAVLASTLLAVTEQQPAQLHRTDTPANN